MLSLSIYVVVRKVLLCYNDLKAYYSEKGTRLMANMAGDEVLLNCTISLGSEQAEDDVIWTRDGKAINLNNTDKYIWKVKRSAGVVVHTVRIQRATMEDDGDYACESRYQRASQIVHVNSAFVGFFFSLNNPRLEFFCLPPESI
ncbi:unnamed protein product [Angiostrongylus costaricensis]|uniref:Ig-like domain-containing protein n=1 Tax=Angiostrongylus costaricensis TaxID=334426 RepID=A0A0R3PQQ4_ANGCS|nr:unnamed protein product [Angiostrongylus costaricensis]